MPDQFPTLEAAATLGFAFLLWRTVLLTRISDADVAANTVRLRAGRARDLVVLVVLLGATLYGVSAKLSPWFVAMCAGSAVLAVIGGALRYRIASRTPSAPGATTRKRSRHRQASPGQTAELRCPRCRASRLVAVERSRAITLHAAATASDDSSTLVTRVSSLQICPACGYLQGTVEDRQALCASRRPDPEDPKAPPEEERSSDP